MNKGVCDSERHSDIVIKEIVKRSNTWLQKAVVRFITLGEV